MTANAQMVIDTVVLFHGGKIYKIKLYSDRVSINDTTYYSFPGLGTTHSLAAYGDHTHLGYIGSSSLAWLHSTNLDSLQYWGDAVLARGTYNSGWTEPNLGAGTRFLWYPKKMALRAGYVNGTQWDNANIGLGSTALGYLTMASGESSFAAGSGSKASGLYSTALCSSKAESIYCTSLGLLNTGGGSSGVLFGNDPLFQIGNGTSPTALSNAFEVKKNGNTIIGGNLVIKSVVTDAAHTYVLTIAGDTVKKITYYAPVHLADSNVWHLGYVTPKALYDGLVEFSGGKVALADSNLARLGYYATPYWCMSNFAPASEMDGFVIKTDSSDIGGYAPWWGWQHSLTLKQNVIATGTTGQYFKGDLSLGTMNSSAVGLSNVENTALSTWAGSTSINTIASTISAGTYGITFTGSGSVAGSNTGDNAVNSNYSAIVANTSPHYVWSNTGSATATPAFHQLSMSDISGSTSVAYATTAGTVTINANLTGDVTSSGNATTIKTSVTLVTPNLGKATATKIQSDSVMIPGVKAYGNSGTAMNIYCSQQNTATITRTGNCTFTLVGGVSGETLAILFTHEASSTTYSVAFSPQVTWTAAPTFTNTTGAKDIVVLKLIGSTWFGQVAGPFNTLQ